MKINVLHGTGRGYWVQEDAPPSEALRDWPALMELPTVEALRDWLEQHAREHVFTTSDDSEPVIYYRDLAESLHEFIKGND